MNKWDLSKLEFDKDLSSQVVAHLSEQDKQNKENGIIGKIIGCKDNAPVNIISLTLVTLIILLIIYMFWGDNSIFPHKEFMMVLLPFITTLVGYLVSKNEK